MLTEQTKQQISNFDNLKILHNESLKKHTTFGIGGKASLFIYPKEKEDLVNLLKYSTQNNIEVFFIGSGSNILVSDRGFKGIVISLQKTFKKFNTLFKPYNKLCEVSVDSGVMLGHMVRILTKNSITGIESLIGVPGTIGGAIIMNAGAYGREISNYLINFKTVNKDGVIKKYNKEDIEFSYRHSSIPESEIILEANFRFNKGIQTNIDSEKKKVSFSRKSKQPLRFRSAGSIFKNPNKSMAAGYLIDQANLKGLKKGDAEISTKHANFIINHGGASSDDVLHLIKHIKKEVKTKFNIDLKLEIKLLGFKDMEIKGVS